MSVDLSIPKELGGPGKAGATNPEQLFAAGFAACFESAIRHIARMKKITIEELSVEADIGLTAAPTGYALLVGLHVMMPGMDAAKCKELVDQADAICPYSNAVRGNISKEIRIN